MDAVFFEAHECNAETLLARDPVAAGAGLYIGYYFG